MPKNVPFRPQYNDNLTMQIALRNIEKRFGSKSVLNNVQLHINDGEICCLLGKNGAGKTTIINTILGLISADSGDMLYENETYERLPNEVKLRIGTVLDSGSIIEELTALDFLKLSASIYKVPKKEADSRIKDLTELFFEDPKDLNKALSGFSTGMKKKISLSASILHLPDLLILDEPFSGLDPIAANQVIELIQMYRNENRSVLLSSHDLSYVERVGTHIAVLSEGSIVFHDTVSSFTQGGKEQLDNALLKVLNPTTIDTKTKLTWL